MIITIETGFVNLDESYVAKHAGIREGHYAVLAVSDTGIGMDKETQEKIFEPFFTTKDKFKGTGLGLAMVYGIVKQNNGSIYVYSEPNEGTTFKIYWPVIDLYKESPVIEAEQVIESGSERIMLVEVDPAVRTFAVSAFQSLGYEVIEASNGAMALELLKEINYEIDLLITDLVMPEMNGKELADQARKLLPRLKIIFVSGYANGHITHNGTLEEGVNFIHKPYSLQTMAREIRKAFDDES